MNASIIGDNIHRGLKMALDSGEVASLTEAERLFASYRLMIEVGADIAHSPTLQAALLTVVNTGRRSCLGGVQVAGNLDTELCVPWKKFRTLGEAVIDLQGQITNTVTPLIPRIVIGDVAKVDNTGDFAVRITFNGWSGGVIPVEDNQRLPEQQEFVPSGVLAGALAVSEAFQFLRGNALAGKRGVGLSLWGFGEGTYWLEADPGPILEILPSRIWLIGLGHLGQAYLWTLGFLPYAHPEEVQLVLQDYDTLVLANDSTSLLTSQATLGVKKTRAVANWAEERGFCTTIQERYFRNNFMVSDDESSVALCGVDNRLARAALEDVGFRSIVEAGLGRGPQGYLAFQIHNFPSSRSARTIWGKDSEISISQEIINQPAYQKLASEGLDQCGLIMVADRTVGAPFVGATTAALVIAELLRIVMGEHCYEVVNGNLRSLAHLQAIVNKRISEPFNPGWTRAK